MRRGTRSGRATEAAVTAGEEAAGLGEQGQIVVGVPYLRFRVDERALVRALVVGLDHPRIGDELRRGRKRTVEHQPFLAMQHPAVVPAAVLEEANVGEHRRHAGHGLEGAALEDEVELLLIERVPPHPDPERVEQRLLVAVAESVAPSLERHQVPVVDRHQRPPPSQTRSCPLT